MYANRGSQLVMTTFLAICGSAAGCLAGADLRLPSFPEHAIMRIARGGYCPAGDASSRFPTLIKIQAQKTTTETPPGSTKQEGDPSVNVPPVIVPPIEDKNLANVTKTLLDHTNPIQGDPSKGVPPVIRGIASGIRGIR